MRAYAIGDIHGQLDQLVAAHRRIARDRRATGDHAAPVIHLGDLVDRGPESAQVIEYLRLGQAEGHPWLALKGNHDAMFERFLGDPGDRDPGLRADLTWLDTRLGGRETLRSYGVDADPARPVAAIWADAVARVPTEHRDWLIGLPLWHEMGDVLFVHAGIRPGVPLRWQTGTDMMWIRKGWLDYTGPLDWLVVHGHTVVDAPERRGQRVNLDTGAGYGQRLTAAVIEDGRVWVLEDGGRLELPGPA